MVLESGLDTFGALSWGLVHDSLAATMRSVACRRAGVVRSDRRGDALAASGVAADLHAAPRAAGESGPWVLAGHALGGPLILSFTGRPPDEVAPLVLVDASHPDQLERLAPFMPGGAMPSMTPLKVASALSWTGLVRLATRGAEGQKAQPEGDRRAVNACTATSLGAALRELDALARVLDEARQFQSLGDRPLVVLTAMKPATAGERAAMGVSEEQAAGIKRCGARCTWSRRRGLRAAGTSWSRMRRTTSSSTVPTW